MFLSLSSSSLSGRSDPSAREVRLWLCFYLLLICSCVTGLVPGAGAVVVEEPEVEPFLMTLEDIVAREEAWAMKALERRGHVFAGSDYLKDLLHMDHHSSNHQYAPEQNKIENDTAKDLSSLVKKLTGAVGATSATAETTSATTTTSPSRSNDEGSGSNLRASAKNSGTPGTSLGAATITATEATTTTKAATATTAGEGVTTSDTSRHRRMDYLQQGSNNDSPKTSVVGLQSSIRGGAVGSSF